MRAEAVTFIFGQPTPDPVGFPDRESMLTALQDHRATSADGLGRSVAGSAAWTPFALGVEEEGVVDVSTFSFQLPRPQIGHWTWKSG